MNTIIRISLVCLAVISVAAAVTPNTRKRLTVQRIAELTASSEAPPAKSYTVEISGIGACTLPTEKPMGELISGRPLRFPNEFEPPQAAANGAPGITPTTPTAFVQVHTGWTVELVAKAHGKLIAVSGAADYVQAEFVPGGYGALAGPIYTAAGGLLTHNKLDQPKLQTTTTRFHLYAVPGESYEVTLYRGDKSEKHLVTVSAQ